ncbi:hypothetical protein GCM10010946_27360 [Undibacterium squillarum]|uniref:Uncharacterized protein n=1 Tax=Undibacterium squillarum TaxID=1131567 RepID=A0ABQ2Y1F3_9BURK|nr:hypothetical protein GCM10010946_27360 [Undibacterium squillarum]
MMHCTEDDSERGFGCILAEQVQAESLMVIDGGTGVKAPLYVAGNVADRSAAFSNADRGAG